MGARLGDGGELWLHGALRHEARGHLLGGEDVRGEDARLLVRLAVMQLVREVLQQRAARLGHDVQRLRAMQTLADVRHLCKRAHHLHMRCTSGHPARTVQLAAPRQLAWHLAGVHKQRRCARARARLDIGICVAPAVDAGDEEAVGLRNARAPQRAGARGVALDPPPRKVAGGDVGALLADNRH